MARATFGAGCFWGVEATFQAVEGVTSTEVGYAGGDKDQPSYEDVCTGTTNHAEVVDITFDPEIVSFRALLAIFWANHNPTTLNSQGPDFGTQYRSVIFTHDQLQMDEAEASKATEDASGNHSAPIVTIIEPFGSYWPAEDYHQKYLDKRGQTVCHV